MSLDRKSAVDYSILHAIQRRRRSPYAFSGQPIEEDLIRGLFEAARHAPSSYNEQPWRFVITRKDLDFGIFGQFVETLVESNQRWAAHASLLILAVAKLSADRTGKPNGHAFHDVGLATQNLLLAATAHGLIAHPMAGFYPEKVRELFSFPAEFAPVSVIAVGYPGDLEKLPPELRDRQTAAKPRKPLSTLIFSARWGEPAFNDAAATAD
jgi:nitroreductase